MIEYSDWIAVEDAYPDVERIECFFIALINSEGCRTNGEGADHER